MKLTPLIAAALLFGCTHTEAFPTGPTEKLGPLSPTSKQLTFNLANDTSPSWTPDGEHILYTFAFTDSVTVKATSKCLAIVPAEAGTRTFTLCDTRASHADSADLFSAAALGADGQLLFQQSVGRPRTLSPITTVLWLADTTAPLSRRIELARFPKPVGDSVIEYLTDAAWINATTFIAIGNRLTIPTKPPRSAFKDTLARPIYLVRGLINGTSATLTQIPGTEFAARWSFLPNGDLLFARGAPAGPNGYPILESSSIMRIPAEGGTATTFATAPNNGSVRSISCRQVCVVLSGGHSPADLSVFTNSVLSYLDPTDGHFSSISLGAPPSNENFNSWDSTMLSPDQTRVVYRQGRNLFATGLPPQ